MRERLLFAVQSLCPNDCVRHVGSGISMISAVMAAFASLRMSSLHKNELL